MASEIRGDGGPLAARATDVSRAFHGWKLVGALCVILFFTAGGGLYVFPVFIDSLQAEFGWSISEISISAALFAIMLGLSNPLVGSLFVRFGARNVMLAAAALSCLGLLGYAALQNLFMLYAVAVLFGLAVAGTTILPAQTLVTHWFDRLRGRAMGFTMLGIGAGGAVLPPFYEYLIRTVGWRQAWCVGALIAVAIVIPLIAVFVRTKPSDLGLHPDGLSDEEHASARAAAPIRGLSVQRAVATPTFWVLVCVFLLQLLGIAAMNFHFLPFTTQEVGFSRPDAAYYFGLTVGFSIVGRLLFGFLGDRLSPTKLMTLALLLLALGPAVIEVLLLRMGLREPHLLWLYAAPFGTGIGGTAVVLPVLASRCFGELHFSEIMGRIMSGFAIGIIVGIPGAGFIFDRTGSYEWVLILCTAGLLLAALLVLRVRPERYQAEFDSA